jgi:hypothetical protein
METGGECGVGRGVRTCPGLVCRLAFQRDARELIDLDRRRRPARPGYRGDHFARYNLEWDTEGTQR